MPRIKRDKLDLKTIGGRIQYIRNFQKKKQADFAKDLNITQSTLSLLERNEVKPTFEAFQKLGKMGFNLDWLLYGPIEKNKPASHIYENKVMQWDKTRINKAIDKLSKNELRFCRQLVELYVSSLDDLKEK